MMRTRELIIEVPDKVVLWLPDMSTLILSYFIVGLFVAALEIYYGWKVNIMWWAKYDSYLIKSFTVLVVTPIFWPLFVLAEYSAHNVKIEKLLRIEEEEE